MKSFLLQILTKLSAVFQELDFTALGVSLLKVGGIPGWILSWFLSLVGHKIEKKVNQAVDSAVSTYVSDETLNDKKDKDEKQIRDAKTDDELDEAYRDSLR